MQTINIVFYFPNGMTEDYSFNEWVKSLAVYTARNGIFISGKNLLFAETHRAEREFRLAFLSCKDLSKDVNYGKYMPYHTNLKSYKIENITTGNKVVWNTNR